MKPWQPLPVAACLVVAAFPLTASAVEISFIHEGRGSGTLGGNPFGPADFVITALGDTDDRVNFASTNYAIQHTSARISIDGLGLFDFLVPTRTFINDDIDTVGFSRSSDGGLSGLDLFNGPTGNTVDGWDMTTDLGPVIGTGQIIQWDVSPFINTTGGILRFDNAIVPDTTFTAIIPEPMLTGVALSGLALLRTRCVQRTTSTG